MKIGEIYDTLHIHKGLREHMIRVAAVAKYITDAHPNDFDAEPIITACLLHDLGNLIKSKIDTFADMYEPEGTQYWAERKAEMIATYGDNEDRATERMVRELGVPPEVVRIIDVAKLEHCTELKDADDQSSRLLLYADMRVEPYHIVAVAERFADIRHRYAAQGLPDETSRSYEAAILEIEEELFADMPDLSPAEITDASTADLQSSLWSYELNVAR